MLERPPVRHRVRTRRSSRSLPVFATVNDHDTITGAPRHQLGIPQDNRTPRHRQNANLETPRDLRTATEYRRMIYLEMSRDETHGGGAWKFPNCVWAPTERQGGGSWAFWSKVLQVSQRDVVIHLRGIPPRANFVGYSIATGSGFATRHRPPEPGKWEFAQRYYRADLTDFSRFHRAVNLTDVFAARGPELADYFERNKAKGALRRFEYSDDGGRGSMSTQ